LTNPAAGTHTSTCDRCRLPPAFRDLTRGEIWFLNRYKTAGIRFAARETVLREGMGSHSLYAILSGWTFSYRMLPDGRRQILSYGLPGALLGLQAAFLEEMSHSVEALTETELLAFPRDKLVELYREQPGVAAELTRFAVCEGEMLSQHLLSIGRRSAIERLAFLIVDLYVRVRALGLDDEGGFAPPITQQQVADTLGMSIVHTNKTLRRLSEQRLIRWKAGRLDILDLDALKAVAMWEDGFSGRASRGSG
jgi:CRP-like cAMP-binding protein